MGAGKEIFLPTTLTRMIVPCVALFYISNTDEHFAIANEWLVVDYSKLLIVFIFSKCINAILIVSIVSWLLIDTKFPSSVIL